MDIETIKTLIKNKQILIQQNVFLENDHHHYVINNNVDGHTQETRLIVSKIFFINFFSFVLELSY